MQVNRRSFLSCAALSAPALAVAADSVPVKTFNRGTVYGCGTKFQFHCPELKEKVRIFVAGDSHLADNDDRGKPFTQYSNRMSGGAKEHSEAFDATVQNAVSEKVDLLALVGDIISFPTEAGVEHILRKVSTAKIPWMYIAGNHDWHYEGLPGSEKDLRAEWTQKRLLPLYQGQNPLMASKVIKGIRFLAVDDSIYQIQPEQLAFLRQEIARGEPTVLLMHIPLYVPGRDVYSCGSPEWCEATDTIWQIERRARWAKEGQGETSFAFCREAFAAPNMLAVLTGHIHSQEWDNANGVTQLVTPANFFRSSILDITFTP